MGGGPNILLVSLDCARADVSYSSALPTLTELRCHGVTCTTALSPAPLTPVSHASVFTGLAPHEHGLRHMFRQPLPEGCQTISQRLGQVGFRTGAFVSAAALNRWFGLARGFEVYDDRLGGEGRPAAFRPAPETAARSIAWLRSLPRDANWFCFVHFFDAHWPYVETPATAAEAAAANPYEAGLRRADRELGRILEAIAEIGGAPPLVIVFGDHGEDLGGLYENDRGGERLGHPEEFGHGCLLFQTTQHVPLVFAHPEMAPGRYDGLAGLIDIAPSIAAYAGLGRLQPASGIDLLDTLLSGRCPERLLYAETIYPMELKAPPRSGLSELQAAWLDPSTKLIRAVRRPQEMVRFDLARDPNEAEPLDVGGYARAIDWPSLPTAASS